MTTSTEPRVTASYERRLLRASGWGALVAATGYIIVPVFRSVIGAILGVGQTGTYPSPAEIPANEWSGLVAMIVFSAIGIGVLVLTLGTTALASVRLSDSLFTRIGAAFGILAGTSFVLFGAGARGMWSFIAANLSETGADAASQVAALWAVNVAVTAPLFAAIAGVAGWTAWLVSANRNARILPTPALVVVTVIAAILLVAAIGFVFLPVQFLFIPFFATIGIALLVRSRRA